MDDGIDAPIRERTLEEKVNYLIEQNALLQGRVKVLEEKLLPQDPDPEIGLP